MPGDLSHGLTEMASLTERLMSLLGGTRTRRRACTATDRQTDRRFGYWGKIPSRGDFVGAGLSPGLIETWEAWIADVLPSARTHLGDDWQATWVMAPVWRFTLSPGQLGREACSGLWMPSVDRAGRHFPLLLAAEGGVLDLAALDLAEAAGRAAILDDLTPKQLMASLPGPGHQPGTPGNDCGDRVVLGPASGTWWSKRGPVRSGGEIHTTGLPNHTAFLSMLQS